MNQVRTTTTDTAETVTAPELPVADRTGMAMTTWKPSARTPGGNFPAGLRRLGPRHRPYIIVAVHVSTPGDGGKLYGVGSYCEGDTVDAQYFRTREGFYDAIAGHAFSSWRLGQAQGPAKNLPERFEDLPTDHRTPHRFLKTPNTSNTPIDRYLVVENIMTTTTTGPQEGAVTLDVIAERYACGLRTAPLRAGSPGRV